MDDQTLTAGAQSLRRALQLLRLVADGPEQGANLTTLIQQSGLTRSTVHRLLSCLVDEHFVERDRITSNYRLGVDSMQLGFASMRSAPLVNTCRPLMQKLARMSGDTIFLVVRQGDYSLCLHREEGHFPVKVFTTNVGDCRLLGLGAGGLALMATLEDAQIESLFARHEAAYAKDGFTLPLMKARIKKARQSGYSEITDTLTNGVSGVGCVFQASPSSLAALSVGAISVRLPAARKKELGLFLLDQLKSFPDI